jgi:DMSO/TMAO reductase YedYZ molybdopterin-dependent catalytic subunit
MPKEPLVRWLLAATVVTAWTPNSIRPEQAAQPAATATPPAGGVLRIEGLVDKPLHLSVADLGRMLRRTVETRDHDGKLVRYEGVLAKELLSAAGAPLGNRLRGAQLSKFLVVEAADGYRVVFALPELDPDSTDTVVLLADHRDGQLLTEPEGPFRLVVPNEKRQARWVRQVTALRVLQAGP